MLKWAKIYLINYFIKCPIKQLNIDSKVKKGQKLGSVLTNNVDYANTIGEQSWNGRVMGTETLPITIG